MRSKNSLTIVAAILTFSALFLNGCTKEKGNQSGKNTVEGLWVGAYTVTQVEAQGSLFYSLSVYPDGSILVKTKANDGNFYYADGTWSLNSTNEFSATVVTFTAPVANRVTQVLKGTYSSADGKLKDCTWKDTINPNGAPKDGKFTVEEVK